MKRATSLAILLLLLSPQIQAAESPEPITYSDIDAPPHLYKTRTPRDRFTRMMERFDSDPALLDRSSEMAFLRSFLKALDISPSSQTLVFSTTSLQLSFISPANPRAIYFNEDIYVGYIPGGRIEIVGLDPELGGIFYIFDIPHDQRALKFDRSNRCMNCHAGAETGFVPGLVMESVIPGPTGGSLDSFRKGRSGHGLPLSDRFGGWHVTGAGAFTNHLGNLTGRMNRGDILKISNQPGTRFDFANYPVPTSDLLPHLLHEHQLGFVNRVVEASYRARTALHQSGGKLTPEQNAELDEQSRIVTRYLLFADEAALPGGGIEGDANYKTDFLRNRRPAASGAALKDFDLRARLFKNRCSYMIYSPVFEGLPAPMKERIYERLAAALTSKDRDYDYLPAPEKKTIREILKATLNDLPVNW
jgi:hypothetical protein